MNKFDVWLITIVLFISLAFLLLFNTKENNYAFVYYDNSLVLKIDLSKDIFYHNTPIMMTWNTALCLWYLWFPFSSASPRESQFQIFCPIVLINALTLIKPSVLNFSF